MLRHATESWRTSNTARIASLALERCEVLEVGAVEADRAELERRVEEFLARPGRNYLLYPGPGAGPPYSNEGEEVRLIVPDGSWRQARRMLWRVPGLGRLPRISFSAELEGVAAQLRLRRPPRPEGLSTIEAIARAIGAIEGEEVSRPLEEIYRKMVERAFGVRQRSGVAEARRRKRNRCTAGDPVAG